MIARAFLLLLSFSFFASYADDSKVSKNSAKKCDESLTLNGKPIEDKALGKKKKKKKAEDESDSVSSREKILVHLKELLANPKDPKGSTLRDKLSSIYVIKLKEGGSSFWALSLMLGNPSVQYNEKEIQGIEELTKKIVDRGWLIVHDADSAAAPIISRAAGKFSVAIGTDRTAPALHSELNNFLIINDPYLRLSTFGKMDHRAFSPDSISGMAVLLDGNMRSHVPFVRSELKDSTGQWAPEMGEPMLGYNILFTPEKIRLDHKPKKSEPKAFDPEALLETLLTSDLAKILNFTNELSIGNKKIEEHTKGIDGALVIGSGQLPGYHTQEVYRIVKSLSALGVPMTTGGSGGVMKIANQAAYDAGGISIGIPIIGAASLASEKEIFSSAQTLTVPTSGYTSRIPLLLKNKKLILVAPGGSGTMKEIATLLMSQSVHPDPELVFMFIGSKYYGRLLKGLKKYLPEFLTQNMFLVNNADEAVDVFKGLSKKAWSKLDYSKLRSSEMPNRRNDKTSFEEPRSSSFWSFDAL